MSLHPPKSNSLSGARTTEESVMVVRVSTEENPYFNENRGWIMFRSMVVDHPSLSLSKMFSNTIQTNKDTFWSPSLAEP